MEDIHAQLWGCSLASSAGLCGLERAAHHPAPLLARRGRLHAHFSRTAPARLARVTHTGLELSPQLERTAAVRGHFESVAREKELSVGLSRQALRLCSSVQHRASDESAESARAEPTRSLQDFPRRANAADARACEARSLRACRSCQARLLRERRFMSGCARAPLQVNRVAAGPTEPGRSSQVEV
ncbi:hypothetical protein AOLI_G00073910 [Acnodon oligacanthus]